MNNKTKTQKVLEFLEAGNKITDIRAAQIAQSYRLSSIIFCLRHDYGLNIQDRWITNEDTGIKCKEYWLVK